MKLLHGHAATHKLLTLSLILCATAQGWAEFSEGYYDALDGLVRENLKEAAKKCVAAHTRLGYSSLPDYWADTDVYPELYENYRGEMCHRFWDMYSDNIYLIFPGQAGTKAFSINKMQREHVVPKSWWKDGGDVEYTPAYSDLWNLYPSDGPANGAKSNYPLGETDNPSFDNGVTKVGVPKSGFGGGAGKVFEPADDYKGDFARTFFYVATVYDELPWSTQYDYVFDRNAWPTLQGWAIDMLLEWSRRDPVSDKERNRNDAVETAQGNRNPFVDFPELAEFVWGARTTQTFYLNEQGSLTPTRPGDTAVGTIDCDPAPGIGYVDGGFNILADGPVDGLVVLDISGKPLIRRDRVEGGDFFPLPKGVYVICLGRYGKPVKLIVR